MLFIQVKFMDQNNKILSAIMKYGKYSGFIDEHSVLDIKQVDLGITMTPSLCG